MALTLLLPPTSIPVPKPVAAAGGGGDNKEPTKPPSVSTAPPDAAELRMARDYIFTHAAECIQHKLFSRISRAALKELLKADAFAVNELALFEALVKWIDVAERPPGGQDAKDDADGGGDDQDRKIDRRGGGGVAAADEIKIAKYGELISLIRFPLMSLNEVSRSVASSGLVTPVQLLEMYSYLGSDSRTKTSFNST